MADCASGLVITLPASGRRSDLSSADVYIVILSSSQQRLLLIDATGLDRRRSMPNFFATDAYRPTHFLERACGRWQLSHLLAQFEPAALYIRRLRQRAPEPDRPPKDLLRPSPELIEPLGPTYVADSALFSDAWLCRLQRRRRWRPRPCGDKKGSAVSATLISIQLQRERYPAGGRPCR
jgi:hypothetical protein